MSDVGISGWRAKMALYVGRYVDQQSAVQSQKAVSTYFTSKQIVTAFWLCTAVMCDHIRGLL